MMAAQPLSDVPAARIDPALCPFEVGNTYNKEDIFRIFEVPVKQRKGNWNTGYTKYAGHWFICSNLGPPGRTGHDYGQAIQGPVVCIAGIIFQISRMLALDGCQALQITTDRGFVRLDKGLACRQFNQGLQP